MVSDGGFVVGSYSGVGWWVGECLQNGPENCQVCQLNPSVLSVPVERVASTTCGACCLQVDKAPLESYADIGGLEQQIQEIKEAVEYPLSHPELYEDIGIKPPKGVSQGSIRGCPVIWLGRSDPEAILYGAPGTGKTLLAKAVANQTAATFLRVVGSELIQKYLGDGPKLVRELFRVAGVPSLCFRRKIVGFVWGGVHPLCGPPSILQARGSATSGTKTFFSMPGNYFLSKYFG